MRLPLANGLCTHIDIRRKVKIWWVLTQTMLVYSSSLTNRAGHRSKTIKEKILKPHMVVYACNFSPNVEALGQKSKISLDYIGHSRSAYDR